MKDASTMTPREIVAELDRYIIGQDKAKKAVAIALGTGCAASACPRTCATRWRRRTSS